jgi:CASC3/Barentsz eIF4AIII binding
MSGERARTSKLAQARRRNVLEEEDGEPALIDESASEAASEDEDALPLSESEDEEEDDAGDRTQLAVLNSTGKDSLCAATLNTDSQLVPVFAKVADTAVILNGFKDVPAEEDAAVYAMNFEDIDDTISFEPQSKPSRPSIRGGPPARGRGPPRGRPERETFWQRRNKDKEEYKRRLEDPTFTPYVGGFFMHDSRKNRPFDSLNQVPGRGRGRGRGVRGGVREMGTRKVHLDEPTWGHDAFQELEAQTANKPAPARVRLCL